MIGNGTKEVLIIGKDITWDEVHDRQTMNLLRIAEFNPWSQVLGKKIKKQSRNMSHGTVMLESPEFEPKLQLFLNHHLDYLHVYEAFQWCNDTDMQEFDLFKREFTYRPVGNMEGTFDRWYTRFWGTKEFEVLIGDYLYEIRLKGIRKWARKLSRSRMPRLFVTVCPKGYLDRLASSELKQHRTDEYLEAYMPLARWEPDS